MDFPRHVFKCGTAKPVVGGGVGEFTLESRVVRSEEQLKELGADWTSSLAEALKHDAKEEKPKKEK